MKHKTRSRPYFSDEQKLCIVLLILITMEMALFACILFFP